MLLPKEAQSNTNRMALVAASASSFYSIKKFTCHFTNSNIKSHFIKNNLDPTQQQWQTRILLFMLTQRGTRSVPFQLPMLKLPLRLGSTSSLPLLQKFPMSSLNSDANPDAKTVSIPQQQQYTQCDLTNEILGGWCVCSLILYLVKVRAVIKGRVQGVFYRDWTVENAKELELKGWVRNRRDGSVEALFSGSPEKVQEMEQRCRRGPPSAIVTGLDVFPCHDDPGTGFERKQTA